MVVQHTTIFLLSVRVICFNSSFSTDSERTTVKQVFAATETRTRVFVVLQFITVQCLSV